jgi:hypothetical protein
MQVLGLLIACAVAIYAWGAIGFFGWLAVVLYLLGQALTPDGTEADTTQQRGA